MKKSDGWFSNPTQVYWTCAALLEGREITHRDEIGEAKGWRLAAICNRLQKRFGWPIQVRYVGPENIAHYSLPKGTDRQALRFPPSAAKLAEVPA